jgi:purine-binding chemotaxis protein CheW
MLARRQMILFGIGGEEFAIDIGLAKEIVVMLPITPVPETQEYVSGVMNLRGNLVPVLDLRLRLRAGRIGEASAASGPSAGRIIIVRLEGKLTGLIVDGASETIWITEGQIESPPDIITEIGADYIAGIVRHHDRFVTILDLPKALRGEVMHELEEVHRLLMEKFVDPRTAPQADVDGGNQALAGR